jgi:hypothetical protein
MTLTEEQISFLRNLKSWDGIASPENLGPQRTQKENSARQRCKRQGLVTYGGGYWRLTDDGQKALSDVSK